MYWYSLSLSVNFVYWDLGQPESELRVQVSSIFAFLLQDDKGKSSFISDFSGQ